MFDNSLYNEFANVTVQDIPILMRRMLVAEPHQRIDYFEIAKSVGLSAIPFLSELANEPDWEIRHHAVHAIGQLLEEHRTASESLQVFLADSHDAVRHLAALYLVRLNKSTEIAVPILLDDLRACRASTDVADYDEECTRIEIVHSLGHIAPARNDVIDEVSRSLDDPSINVRLAAVETLARFGPSAAGSLPRLRSVLRLKYVEPPGLTDNGSRKAWKSLVYQLQSSTVEALYKIGQECRDDVLADMLHDQNALSFDHHRALKILSALPVSDETRHAISGFTANSEDQYALELARKALQHHR